MSHGVMLFKSVSDRCFYIFDSFCYVVRTVRKKRFSLGQEGQCKSFYGNCFQNENHRKVLKFIIQFVIKNKKQCKKNQT